MRNEIKNYGFVPSEITPDQYILGGGMLPKIILQSDSNWKDHLPKWESQIEGNFETYGCTVFGTLNAVETILNKLNSQDYNYSERYTYILSGITPPGADPHFVSEIIRKYGVIAQEELPMTQSLAEFNTPKPMTTDKLASGQTWLDQYSFGHEWVFTNTPSKEDRTKLVREALQYSPLCVSVTAWYEDDNGLFVDLGQPNSHWCECYGVDDDGGLLIYDSYALVNSGVVTNALKKLHPDHKVTMAKRYNLTPKKKEESLNWIGKILAWLFGDVQNIQKKIDELPKVDKPISPEPHEVYNEVKEAIMEPKRNLLKEFCTAISQYEGGPGDLNHRNNNPGNLRSKFGPFLKFATWDEGFKALEDYVTRACTGKHKAYKPDFTIAQFFSVYAPSGDNNHPDLYANWVAKKIGVPVTTKIRDLLT